MRLPPPTVAAATLASWERPGRALVSNLDLPPFRLTLRTWLEAGATPEVHLSHGGDTVTIWRLPAR